MEFFKMIETMRLTKIFPLINMRHLIKDKDGDIWLFREYLHNGMYAKYTLTGKNYRGQGYIAAHLYAKLPCGPDAESAISVFIEDIVTAKAEAHIGSWMMSRLISLLRTAENISPIGRVYGQLVRDAPDVEEKRRNFFKRFGFSIEQTSKGTQSITAELSELHQVAMPEIQQIDIDHALMEWSQLPH